MNYDLYQTNNIDAILVQVTTISEWRLSGFATVESESKHIFASPLTPMRATKQNPFSMNDEEVAYKRKSE